MTEMNVDKEFIKKSLASFTPQEQADYREYVARLLSSGCLMREEAEESACFRVIHERRS